MSNQINEKNEILVKDVKKFISYKIRENNKIISRPFNYNSITTLIYSYLMVLSYEFNKIENISLDEVIKLSKKYNDNILDWFNDILVEELFNAILTFACNNEIPVEVFLKIIDDESLEIYESTPNSITSLVNKILDIKENDNVIEIGSGVGNYLFNGARTNINNRFIGYEINSERFLISQIRNYIHNMYYKYNNVEIVQADAFDIPFQNNMKNNSAVKKVFSNYPFGLRLRNSKIGNRYIENLAKEQPQLVNLNSSDWIFNKLIQDIAFNTPKGKAIGIMTGGSSWNERDKAARKYFIQQKTIECIISLPAKLFNNTAIPVMLIVFNQNSNNIRMIDATNLYTPGRRQNIMNSSHIDKIIEATRKDSDYSKLVTYEDIVEQDYLLNPNRYLKQQINIENGVVFESVIKSITRGAQIKAKELDDMVSKSPTKYKYLMLNNIENGIIDNNLHYLKSIDKKYEKYCIKNNDLIISKNGSPYKISVVKTNNEDTILANGSLYIIRLDLTKVNPFFIMAFLESEIGENTLNSITVGATIPNISVNNLKKIKIPLPSINEQKVIANKFLNKLEEIQALNIKLEIAKKSLKEVF